MQPCSCYHSLCWQAAGCHQCFQHPLSQLLSEQCLNGTLKIMVSHPHCFHDCLLVGTCQFCLSNCAVFAKPSCCSLSTIGWTSVSGLGCPKTSVVILLYWSSSCSCSSKMVLDEKWDGLLVGFEDGRWAERELCGEILQNNCCLYHAGWTNFPFLKKQAVCLLHLFCAKGAAYCLYIEILQCISFDIWANAWEWLDFFFLVVSISWNSKFELLSFDIDKNRLGLPSGAAWFLAIWFLTECVFEEVCYDSLDWTSAATEKQVKSICICHPLSDVALHKVKWWQMDISCSA